MRKQLPVIPESPLPPLYARWMDQLLAAPIPHETDATCSECAMLPVEGEGRPGDGHFFEPETKCCTYLPRLPNYLVGAILADDDPNFAKGRTTVVERIARRLDVTPLGMGMPRAYKLLYSNSSGFGVSKALRCPHYLPEGGGSCGIWKHRASVCATWYCKFLRGAVGRQFWNSLNRLLNAVEHTLELWCVHELKIELESLSMLLPKESLGGEPRLNGLELDGEVDPEVYKRIWGKWFGSEHEFYKESARLVSGLDWSEVVGIGGVNLKIIERLVRDAYSKLNSEELPPNLKLTNLNVIPLDRKSSRIGTYSPLDPLQVPNTLVSLLPYFDGRPTEDALKAIEKRERVKLEPALVRRLADFGILVPVVNKDESSK